MDGRKSLQDHLNRIQEIRDQLLAIGRKMEEEDIVLITLKNLPRSYKHFIKTLNITYTGVDLKFTDLCTLLLQQDRWKQQFGSSSSSTSTEQAFSAKSFQKDKGKSHSQLYSQQSSQQRPSTPASEGSKKKNIQCNYCHKYGRMKVECRKRLASLSKQSSSQPKANSAEHTEQTESAFYAFMAKRPTDHVKSSAWYIYSGASRHFTHHKDWFTDCQTYLDSVIFGGGKEYTVVGKGNIQIQSAGRNLIFLDVYHVPGMELNLLSISQMLRHSPRLDITFSSHQCTITDRETLSIVAIGLEDHGLFRLADSGTSQDLAMTARQSSVHADICGPMATPVLGFRYFLLFVDDFSRKMWVYFLNKKFEAFTVFQKFKPLVENESRKSIIALRTDNEGEFCSNEFSSFCDLHGIKRQLTTPHTPQQNSVVERRNRTITEMARSMLEHRHVPKKFWAEAVNTAVYLLNRSPSVAVKGKTPEEAWSGRKPKISHLKVFGSLACVWIPDASRTKSNAKIQKLMLARYSSLHKAYRLIDIETSRLMYSHDVIFDEQQGPLMPVSLFPDSAD